MLCCTLLVTDVTTSELLPEGNTNFGHTKAELVHYLYIC